MSPAAGKDAMATLDLASLSQPLTVQKVMAPSVSPEWGNLLEEIGFIAGETVMLMARAMPGGDPLGVRMGQSTFALRRAEAACIGVAPANSEESALSAAFVSLEGSKA